MDYSFDLGIWNQVFLVPAEVVDKHLRFCGGAQLKVLLLILRNAGKSWELGQLSAQLSLSQADVQDALHYWIEAGILPGKEGGLAARLLAGQKDLQTAVPQQLDPSHKRYEVGSAPRQRLTPVEISRMAQHDDNLKVLISEAEASLGKTLSSSDLSTLVSLYDWAGIPVDVLLVVIEYCKLSGKTNFRYIEKTAVSWQEQGINTLEKAERHIKDNLELERKAKLVKAAFGIFDRSLTTKETSFIKTWFDEYHFDIPVIKLAYERAIENIGKLNFAYINKVLINWHSQGITSPEQAQQETAKRNQQQDQSKSSYDIEEFEQYLNKNTPG